jgi:hypothetical protein
MIIIVIIMILINIIVNPMIYTFILGYHRPHLVVVHVVVDMVDCGAFINAWLC